MGQLKVERIQRLTSILFQIGLSFLFAFHPHKRFVSMQFQALNNFRSFIELFFDTKRLF